jgi:hypothetical protein
MVAMEESIPPGLKPPLYQGGGRAKAEALAYLEVGEDKGGGGGKGTGKGTGTGTGKGTGKGRGRAEAKGRRGLVLDDGAVQLTCLERRDMKSIRR